MSKNPFINALFASVYIILIVALMNWATQPLHNKPDTFFAPVTMLSVLTLSVVVMAFLFFYQPFQLFIEGKKKESINFLIKTVTIFAIFTFIISILLFSGIL